MSVKYREAEKAVLSNIENGTYAEGERIPSERDLAAALGMSHMTLRQGISRLVDRGILERRPSVGTFVLQRPSKSVGLRNLALLFFNMTSIAPQSFAQFELEEVRKMAAEDGRQLRAMVLVPPYPNPAQLAEELRAMQVGAAGVVNFRDGDRAYIGALNSEIPCVLVNKSLPGLPLPCAKPDMVQAATSVVDFMASRGRHRLAAMVWDADHSQQREFMVAMEHQMARRHMPIDKSLWFETPSASPVEEGIAWMRRLLDRADLPDAIVLCQSHEWLHSLRADLMERGLCIGKDLDVVAHGVGGEIRNSSDPWANVSLRYHIVTSNAARLLAEAADAGPGERSARVLVSETKLTPPGS